MRKPAIPVTSSLPLDIAQVVEPLKQNVELITGARPGSTALSPLASTATLSDVITQVNLILSRINRSG
ncbi:hypothetical protein EBT25_13680 [bacterium]|nr:hypothetical protein [bacterium]